MPLLEHEAHRFAVALDDYDDLSVTDIGGTVECGYWLVVDDERFDGRYELRSHADYWDVVAGLAVGRPASDVGRSVVPASQAATSAATA